ncbi:MAG TPA: terminase large subunit [Gaiellaceae bacterium]|nr:terminase large subunit [Gaiellaceae bacterium]
MNLPNAVAPTTNLAAFIRFAGALTLDQGGPLELEPFQRSLLADYFAGVRETLVLLPKKNGKTTLLGALALFHLLATDDAECVIGAASRDQATILYDQAAGFISRDERLQRRILTRRGYRELRSRKDGGRIRVLAADVDTADGVIPTLALVDELHRHKSADLYGVFRDGLGPRHGQMVTISTAGDHELSPLGEMRTAARKLPGLTREGHHLHVRTEDDSFAMHEWALESHEDTDDMRLVKEVNPASWQTTDLLAQRHTSPSMLPWQWARFACGVWVGAQAWWVRPEEWNECEVPAVDVLGEPVLRAGDRITLGFDGSRYGDATALVACRLEDGLLQVLGIWEAPRGVREWEVPAGEVDEAIAETMEEYAVVRGYFDPPLWQSEIDAWAREYGDPAITRYPTNRSRFMGAVERFRTDLLAEGIPHVTSEVLTRHVLNAQMRAVRGGYWLEKGAAAERIDAAVAAVLAYEARCDAIGASELDRGEFAFL